MNQMNNNTGETTIRIFNEKGKEEYQKLITSIESATYKPGSISNDLLLDDQYTEQTPYTYNLDEFTKQRKHLEKKDDGYLKLRHYDFVKFIHGRIEFNEIDINKKAGLCDWLLANSIDFYVNGKLNAGEKYSTQFKGTALVDSYYRHYLFAPLFIYNEFKDKSRHVLSGYTYQWGDRLEQICGRPQLFWNESIINLFNLIFEELWINSDKDIYKYGKKFDSSGYGNIVIRLLRDLNRLAKNWNFSMMTTQEILDNLIDSKYKGGIKQLEKIKPLFAREQKYF